MAIFKPSNCSLNGAEIDAKVPNTFSIRANTSGEEVKGYAVTVLDSKTRDEIYKTGYITLERPIKNKEYLEIELPADSLVNNKSYELTVRMYNEVKGETNNYNSLVTRGMLVGSEKTYLLMRAPKDETLREKIRESVQYVEGQTYITPEVRLREITKYVTNTYDDYSSLMRQAVTTFLINYLNGNVENLEGEIELLIDERQKEVFDHIKYDMYAQLDLKSSEYKDRLIITPEEAKGNDKDSPLKLPVTAKWSERTKIDWVTTKLGPEKDWIIVELSQTEIDDENKGFTYHPTDGTEFSLYQVSGMCTPTQFFVDPGVTQNVKVGDYVLIYANAEDAMAAREAGDNPGSASFKVAPVFPNAKKVIGISSDTGSIRLNAPLESSPKVGMVPRFFKYSGVDDIYTEEVVGDKTASQGYHVTASSYYFSPTGSIPAGIVPVSYTDTQLTTPAPSNDLLVNPEDFPGYEFEGASYSTKVPTFIKESEHIYKAKKAEFVEIYKEPQHVCRVYVDANETITLPTDLVYPVKCVAKTYNGVKKVVKTVDTTENIIQHWNFTKEGHEIAYKKISAENGKFAYFTKDYTLYAPEIKELAGIIEENFYWEEAEEKVEFTAANEDALRTWVKSQLSPVYTYREPVAPTTGERILKFGGEENAINNYIPGGVQTYYDSHLKYKKGITGPQYTVINDKASKVAIFTGDLSEDFKTLYISTPKTFEVYAFTPYYSDEKCANLVGYTPANTTLKGNFRTTTYSTVTVSSTTYYIKTPSTGVAAQNTPLFKNESLTEKAGFVSPADSVSVYTVDNPVYSSIKDGSPYALVTNMANTYKTWCENGEFKVANIDAGINETILGSTVDEKYYYFLTAQYIYVYTDAKLIKKIANANNFKFLVYGAGKFVGLCDNGTYGYSTDCESWTIKTMPQQYTVQFNGYNVEDTLTPITNYNQLYYANGYFIATSRYGMYAMVSVDGISWDKVGVYRRWYGNENLSFYADEVVNSDNWKDAVNAYKGIMHTTCFNFSCIMFGPTDEFILSVDSATQAPITRTAYAYASNPASKFYFKSWEGNTSYAVKKMYKQGTNIGLLSEQNDVTWITSGGTSIATVTNYLGHETLLHFGDITMFCGSDGIYKDNGKTIVNVGAYKYTAELNNTSYIATPKMNGINMNLPKTTYLKTGITADYKGWRMSQLSDGRYVPTPINSYNGVPNYTKLYTDKTLKASSGVSAMEYYMVTDKLSWTELGYIQTPQTGTASGVPVYSDPELTECTGVVATKYTKVNESVVSFSLDGNTYYAKSPQTGYVFAGVKLYNDANLTDYYGVLEGKEDFWIWTDKNNEASCRCNTSEGVKYIEKPSTGFLVQNNMPYYQDDTLATLAGTYNVTSTTYTIKDKWVSTISLDGQIAYIHTPDHGYVTNGTIIYSDTELGYAIYTVNENTIYKKRAKTRAAMVIDVDDIPALWSSTKTYKVNDLVLYLNSSDPIPYVYKATAAHSGSAPEEGTNWVKVNDYITHSTKITSNGEGKPYDTAANTTTKCYWIAYVNGKNYYIEEPNTVNIYNACCTYDAAMDPATKLTGTIDANSYLVPVQGFKTDKDLLICITPEGRYYVCVKDKMLITSNADADTWWLGAYKGDAELSGRIYKGTYTYNDALSSLITYGSQIYYIQSPIAGMVYKEMPCQPILFNGDECTEATITIEGKTYIVNSLNGTIEKNSAGGKSASIESYQQQTIGGNPVKIIEPYNIIISNVDGERIFIQPNINIKTDKTNPPQLIFDNEGRMDLIQKLDGNRDITFVKISDAVWMLESEAMRMVKGQIPVDGNQHIYPTCPYEIWACLQDQMPASLFNTKTTADMNILAIDLYQGESYTNITNKPTYAYRDIGFKTEVNFAQGENMQVNYYRYILYRDSELLEESETFYNNDLTWEFKGLLSDPEIEYEIECIVTDNYGKTLSIRRPFKIEYSIEEDEFVNFEFDCDLRANKLTIIGDGINECVYTIYRKTPKELTYTFLKTITTAEGFDFIDSNVASGEYYTYNVVKDDPTLEGYKQWTLEDYVVANYEGWLMQDIIKQDDGSYATDDNLWKYTYAINSGAITQNIGVSYTDSLSKYGKATYSDKNYASGNLSALLGEVKHYKVLPTGILDTGNRIGYTERMGDSEYDTEADKLKLWKKFITNGNYKILKSPKGEVFIVAITASPTYDHHDTSNLKQTTISVSWTEIVDSNKQLVLNTVNAKAPVVFTLDKPFKIGFVKDGNLGWYGDGKFQYSYDRYTWVDWDGEDYIEANSIDNLFELSIRGIDNSTFNGSTMVILGDGIDGQVTLGGDVSALLDNFHTTKQAPGAYAHLFEGCTAIGDASNLKLAEDVMSGDYAYMFKDCINLTAAPNIPNDTAVGSYEHMFENCTQLKESPNLPATNMSEGCYAYMFANSGVETTSELPASVMAVNCYKGMYKNCRNLTTIKPISGSVMADSCYKEMFSGCTELIAGTTLNSVSMEPHCYEEMFNGCYKLKDPIILPADKLALDCYKKMFYGCTSIKFSEDGGIYRLPAKGTTVYSGDFADQMFFGCMGYETVSENGTPLPNTDYHVEQQYVKFSSESPLTLSEITFGELGKFETGWTGDGTAEYSYDNITWYPWNGEPLIGNNIYIRGSGNTTFNGKYYSSNEIAIGGLYVQCDTIVAVEGDLDAILDYEKLGSINYGLYALSYVFGLVGYLSMPDVFGTDTFYPATLNLSGLTLRKAVAEGHYSYCFTGIKSNNTLPKMTMGDIVPDYGYNRTFMATDITEFYTLHATTVGKSGYEGMFERSSLSIAPELPAVNLGIQCYKNMFDSTNIIKAPALPATTVPERGYEEMFRGTKIKKCPELPAMNLGKDSYSYMFENCTLIELPCDLPATNIPDGCYKGMFARCSSIKFANSGKEYRIPVTGTGTVGVNSLQYMFVGCSGTAPTTPNVNTTYYLDYYEPLTFSSASSFKVGLVDGWKGGGDVYWSTDKNTWTPWTGTTALTPAYSGGKYVLYIRGENNSALGHTSKVNSTKFKIEEGKPDVSGFLSTLIDYSRAANDTIQSYGYAWLFTDCILGDVSGLKINNTTVNTIGAYHHLFDGSTISNIPELGIPNGLSTYEGTFANCKQLKTVAAELPLGGGKAYVDAFKGSGITEVKSTIFTTEEVDYGYYLMFEGCEELTTIPVLPKLTSGKEYVFMGMYHDCTALTAVPDYFFPNNSVVGKGGYSSIFSGCSALEKCPNCPVMTLTEGLFKQAFEGCVSLAEGMNFAPIDNTPGAKEVFSNMFEGCSVLKTATIPKWTSVPERGYFEMYKDCIRITAPPVFDYLMQVSNYGLSGMFNGCTKIEWGMVGTEYVITPPTSTGLNAFKDMFVNTTNDELVDNGTPEPGIIYYLQIPLYFESTSTFSVQTAGGDGELLCSTDYDNWIPFTGVQSAAMYDGTYRLYVKGSNNHFCDPFVFPTGNSISVVGPIVNLLGTTEDTWHDEVFEGLFAGNGIDDLSKISNVTGLIMPKHVVGKGAFKKMFAYSKIVSPPEMRYDTLTEECFMSMFEGCTNLKTIPELPATVMKKNCYNSMFRYTPVSNASTLLDTVTTLEYGCFEGMFAYSGIENAPKLPLKNMKERCYREMFKSCAKLTTHPEMPKLSEMLTEDYCCYEMFRGCENLALEFEDTLKNVIHAYAFGFMYDKTKVQKVSLTIQGATVNKYSFTNMFSYTPVTEGTLNINGTHSGESIYEGIFQGCTELTKMEGEVNVSNNTSMFAYAFDGDKKLAKVPIFVGTYSATNVLQAAFRNTSLTGIDFIDWSNITEVGSSAFNETFSGCTLLVTVPDKLPKPSTKSYMSMFQSCTSLTIAPDFADDFTTAYESCCANMYNGCTKLKLAPAIPATQLGDSCFAGMFRGCASLTRPSEMPQSTVLAPKCYENMYYGCSGIEWSHDSNEMFELSTTAIVTNPATYASGMFFGNTRLKDATMPISGTPNFNETYYFKFIPFWFEATDGSVIQLSLTDNEWKGDGYLKYSLDEGETWMNWNYEPISGKKIYIQGVNVTRTGPVSGGSSEYSTFELNANHKGKVCGNIKGLVHDISSDDKACAYLFWDCSDLYSAGDLMLHDTVTPYCYYGMFGACMYLHTPPTMPAKTLAQGCYKCMFEQSVGLYGGGMLTPILPAINLAANCYEEMFLGCYMETPPVLPATTLAPACYDGMFTFSKITSVPALPATVLVSDCYRQMFASCDKLEVDLTNYLPSTQLAVQCYYCMFEKCTKLTKLPNLPATILYDGCYKGMFNGCTAVTTTPQLPATIIANSAYQQMFKGCTALVDGDILNHNTTSVGEYGCASMFEGCTALTELPVLSATTLGIWAYNKMFKDCTSINTIPELPATTLSMYCYAEMFSGCTKIIWGPFGTEWKVSATTPVAQATTSMFKNCTILDNADMPQTGTPVVNATYHLLDVNGYVTFESDGAFTTTIPTAYGGEYIYSTDKETWKGMTLGTAYSSASHEGKHRMYIAGTGRNVASASNASDGILNSGRTDIKVYGDLGMLNAESTDMSYMFYGNTCIKDISGLTMTKNKKMYKCEGAFMYCSVLTTVPDISSDTILDKERNCSTMYYGCTALKTAPALKATTLAPYCYSGMFRASGLTSIPTDMLPATTLAKSCYQYMFANTKITSAPNLLATTLQPYCYNNMFYHCASLAQAPTLPATTMVDYCYQNMFEGCTKLKNPPTLAATTLADYCYDGMFKECTSLVACPTLSATVMKAQCYMSMFSGCTSLKECPSLPATTLAVNCYREMFKDCNSITILPALPATTYYNYCYRSMFENCIGIIWSNKGTTYRIPSSSSSYSSATDMFADMFKGCSFMSTSTMPTTGVPNRNTPYYYNGGYVTFEAPTSFNLKFSNEFKYNVPKSADWTEGTTSGTLVTAVQDTDNMYRIRATASGTKVSDPSARVQINSTSNNGNVVVKGELIDLIGSTNVRGGAQKLFHDNSALKDASGLIFPNWTMEALYKAMFESCSNLVTPPTNLPATSVGQAQYSYMFNNCPKLTTPPTIAATSFESGTTSISGNVEDIGHNFYYMFGNCTSLTKAPEIKTIYMGFYTYGYMFMNCKALIDPPVTHFSSSRGSGISVNAGCSHMFTGCSSLTSAIPLPATQLGSSEYEYMFSGTAITTAPELPATSYMSGVATTTGSAYFGMFNSCASLITPPSKLSISSSHEATYSNMFVDCTALTTAPVLNFTTIGESGCNMMFRNCKSLTTPPQLKFTTVPERGCYYMFASCSNLTSTPTFTINTMSGDRGCDDMFYACSALAQNNMTIKITSVPDYGMYCLFQNCKALTEVPSISTITGTIGKYGLAYAFEGTAITTAPQIKAGTIGQSGCYSMLENCKGITAPPVINATTFDNKACYRMCANCSNIKWTTDSSKNSYRIPNSGTGTAQSDSFSSMFNSNSGTGIPTTPAVNTTYYYE